MKFKMFLLAGCALGAAIPSVASAANIAPTSYAFDVVNDCGSWCYYDFGHTKLTDGVRGRLGWAVNSGQEWAGWTDQIINIDFSFSGSSVINAVNIGTTQDSPSDVVLPSFNLFSSMDGVTWSSVASLVNPVSNANNHSAYDNSGPSSTHALSGLNIQAPYVRLQVLNNGPWAFIDEVSFEGSAGAVPEPASWGMMILGFGIIGAATRRAKAKVSFA